MAMTLKRYETLRTFLHLNDNDSPNNPKNSNDKLFKVTPLLDLVRDNCVKVEPDKSLSIDEQIIPAKIKCSSRGETEQPEKIHKWAFKNISETRSIWDRVRIVYGGKHNAGVKRYGA